MKVTPTLRVARLVIAASLIAGCSPSPPPPSGGPTASPTTAPTPSPTPEPSPTVAPPLSFPLAVVTGLTTLKSVITVDEVIKLAATGKLLLPCGVTITAPALTSAAACVQADQIVGTIRTDQAAVALLPPALVEPATKVLAIAGDGPYGLFGPDLFGGPEARALPYPIQASAPAGGPGALDPAWTGAGSGAVWTMTALGSLCADRGAARQAVTLKKGWDWVFDGGTAKYKGPPIPNPNPPPGIDRHPIVQPVETGNAGATARLIRGADVTLGNLKCPVLPTSQWRPANQALGLSVPEDVLTRWEDFLGIDAVYLPADHQSDRGVRGIRSTLQLLDKHGFPHTGLGMDLDQALAPAYLDVAGLKVAFVAWNNVPGPTHAAPETPGVAWLNEGNVRAAVARAKAGGADVIICDPQWWGPDEYVIKLTASQKRALGWMDAAGCDQVLGGGLHVTGAIDLRGTADGVSLVQAGPGNFQYGQDFWQQTQEGVVAELTFRGPRLVNVRVHPYVMILAARAALLDPERDGRYVLQRIWKSSHLDYGASAPTASPQLPTATP